MISYSLMPLVASYFAVAGIITLLRLDYWKKRSKSYVDWDESN